MGHKKNNRMSLVISRRKPSRAKASQLARLTLGILPLAVFGLGLGALTNNSLLASAALQGGPADQQIGGQAVLQISALMEEKLSRTPAQRKLDSHLHFAVKLNRGEAIAPGVSSLASVSARVKTDDQQSVVVDIKASVTPGVLDSIPAMGGEVISSFPDFNAIRARMPLAMLEDLGDLPDVQHIGPAEEFMTNGSVDARPTLTSRETRLAQIRKQLAGALPKLMGTATQTATVLPSRSRGPAMAFIGSATSQADHAHQADLARTMFGISGSGVKIGVLSNGVDTSATRIATGDLPASLTVLPGQAGTGDEGTAMLEIIHDLAPGAQLFYATALGGTANFANNIIALRNAGCDIIVDDITYLSEAVYQDGPVSQAVNAVTAAGALYFTSAGNSGNKNDSQSGTWEGDFLDSGQSIPVLPGAGIIHSFGGGNISNQLTTAASNGAGTGLKWSDPLGGSSNDYDLYVLNSTLTAVIDASTDFQTGTQNPFEFVVAPAAGRRFVVALFSGLPRALHLATNRGRLAVNTSGAIYGHNAAGAAYTVAAVDVRTVGSGIFTTANVVQTYSSDGPRRIFYNPNGTPITPGNVLIGTNGGTVLQKVDITAADCGLTTTPGFITFCGTSAAAPTSAAIAALVKSAKPTATPAEIRTALTSTALDIEAAGFDRDAGFGIIRALAAVTAINPTNPGGNDTIGLFRPAGNFFFLRNSNTLGVPDVTASFGAPGDLPIVGDWDGNGTVTMGLYRPSTSTFFLRNSNTPGVPDVTVSFGNGPGGDMPIAGDWNGDGTWTIGVYRPSTSTFFLRNSNTSGFPDIIVPHGAPGDTPIVGDWDGNGTMTIGLFRSAGNFFFLRNSNTAGFPDIIVSFGASGDLPIAGDWDGNGTMTIGLFRPGGNFFFLRNSNTSGFPDVIVTYGAPGDKPIVGNWDGM